MRPRRMGAGMVVGKALRTVSGCRTGTRAPRTRQTAAGVRRMRSLVRAAGADAHASAKAAAAANGLRPDPGGLSRGGSAAVGPGAGGAASSREEGIAGAAPADARISRLACGG